MNIITKIVVFVFLAGIFISPAVMAADQTVSDISGLKTALSAPPAGASPGDTILLADGTYTIDSWALAVNTPNLTIKSLSGIRENVIVQGQGMTSGIVNHGFWVGEHHVTIQDLTIRNVRNHGIQTDVNIDYLHVKNIIFRDTYEQMLKVPYNASIPDPSENGIVENCLFEYTAGVAPNWYTGGVDVHNGSGWIIRKNIFKDIQSPGGNIAEHAVHFWTGSKDTLVEQNQIINCDRGIGFGLGTSSHLNGIIRNNMIFHDGSGAFADVGIALESSLSTQIYNNTVFFNHSRYPNGIEYRFSGTSGAYIANNLTNKAIISRDSGTGTVSNNETSAQLPWFVNPGSGDLHLAGRISGVNNRGIAVFGLTDDFDGDRRPLSGGIDMGADEYGSGSIVPQIFLLLNTKK